MIETILRNVFAEGRERLLQRKVYYDNLGSDAANRIRTEIRREGERFLRRIDRVLSHYDRDRNPRAPGGERRYAALGIYFLESPYRVRRPERPRFVYLKVNDKKREHSRRSESDHLLKGLGPNHWLRGSDSLMGPPGAARTIRVQARRH